MTKPFSMKLTRQAIMEKLQEKRSVKTADSSRDGAGNSRAVEDPILELIRQASESEVELYKFNDLNDYDIDVAPGVLWESLQVFNTEFHDDKLTLELNLEKKFIKLTIEDL